MTLALILGGAVALYLIWLLFRLAAYALPVYSALGTGLYLLEHHHGYGTAIAGGLAVGVAVLLVGQFLMAFARSPLLRFLVALLFAVPAGAAGYQAARGLGGMMIDPGAGLTALSLFAAALTASSAWRGLGSPPTGDEGAALAHSQQPTLAPNAAALD